MSKHTPGPWQVGRPSEYGTHSCGIVTRVSDGDGVAQVLAMPTNGTLEELPKHYAEQVATARLIAAAPELLKACQELLAAYGEAHALYNLGDCDGSILARAAIAKATGEQP